METNLKDTLDQLELEDGMLRAEDQIQNVFPNPVSRPVTGQFVITVFLICSSSQSLN
jgi:hypothetical protein